jgi:hypothetical protein
MMRQALVLPRHGGVAHGVRVPAVKVRRPNAARRGLAHRNWEAAKDPMKRGGPEGPPLWFLLSLP